MTIRTRVTRIFAARDPARVRLTDAVGISLGVLASALLGLLLVHLLHAETALLAMAVFLSLQAGNMVKDRTAGDRVVTTVLLLPAVIASMAFALVLVAMRPAAMAVFILIAGLAIWLRRFGSRAGSIGAVSFMGYFFTLFMQPKEGELLGFFIIAISAVLTQLVVRLVLLLKRPRRQLFVLLNELQAASASALRAANHPGHARGLRAALARVDDIGRAITDWQQQFRTEQYIACDQATLEARVLDARVDIEQACYAVARQLGTVARHDSTASETATQAYRHLRILLDGHATQAQVTGAATFARRVTTNVTPNSGTALVTYLLARAINAHLNLHGIDLSHGLDIAPSSVKSAVKRTVKPRTEKHRRLRWKPWSEWSASSRMTLQVVVAASLASFVGEAISASRWYWAVMTAYIIFIGASTRGSILTRAYRRVAGTAVGIIVGVAAAFLAQYDNTALIVIAVVSIFGMLYFGPLNYVFSSLFLTVMLVALYGMLGVLNANILELRLIETISGAVIGVLSAYLIFSTNSRPALLKKVNAYFTALDTLLVEVANAFSAKQGSEQDHDREDNAILAALHALEAAQTVTDKEISGMSTAFLVQGSRQEMAAVHLMYIATRSGARLAQSAVIRTAPTDDPDREASARLPVVEVISAVRASAGRTRQALNSPKDRTFADLNQPNALSTIERLPSGPSSPEVAGIMALTTIDWAMRRVISEVLSVSRWKRNPNAHELMPVELPSEMSAVSDHER